MDDANIYWSWPTRVTAEAEFRWQHNQDAMANEMLTDGIRRFASDQQTLELLITQHLVACA